WLGSEGSVVPIAGAAEISRRSYSRASDCLGSSNRCALYVSQSPIRSTLPYVGGSLAEQPASVMAADDARPFMTARRVVNRLLMSSPDDHRPHVSAKAGEQHHRHVPDDERDDRDEAEEVQRARGLMAAENVEQHGERGDHLR